MLGYVTLGGAACTVVLFLSDVPEGTLAPLFPDAASDDDSGHRSIAASGALESL